MGSPLLEQIEAAKQRELAKLGTNKLGLTELLDIARGKKEKPKKKRRRHGLKVIQGGKKELK